MAAGVGKTYRMLQEGQAEQAAGRDVLIGYLEPHERPETAAQAEGLEELPRRSVEYRGHTVEEMDLPAIFRRAPELCLIDELAHSNPPGAGARETLRGHRGRARRGHRRLLHGQHPAPRDAERPGRASSRACRVRETFPDSVLTSADEVVLVDLTPEALTQRLRDGKVYPRQRIATALESFFKVENLSALRELALREVAEDVESKRLVTPLEVLGTREEQLFGEPPSPVAERILVLVKPDDRCNRLVRRAWRSAQRLAAELDLLYVAPPGEPPRGEKRERVEALRRLASILGAPLIVEEGDDLAEAVARVATERGTTYVFMGQPRPRGALERLRESSAERLMRKLPGVDIRIVADPRSPRAPSEP